MPMKPVRTWTCDRCGHKTQTEMIKQASGWVTLYVASPPLMSPSDHRAIKRLLCESCANAVVESATSIFKPLVPPSAGDERDLPETFGETQELE